MCAESCARCGREAALNRTLAGSHGLDAATTGHIAEALTARHEGWFSDDIALLALRVPPRTRT